ncbi:hypothetical protein cyc_07820 [Cyclospora cayetanensis]|uniref:Uncharacterized protein n=1 Tax=Cyclospora cayetanensis TaxID=88456 RepID=A0A1D3D226_9EIME|nr:hypothetical protein cyc_07820 [Cyclospora cayetanensis]
MFALPRLLPLTSREARDRGLRKKAARLELLERHDRASKSRAPGSSTQAHRPTSRGFPASAWTQSIPLSCFPLEAVIAETSLALFLLPHSPATPLLAGSLAAERVQHARSSSKAHPAAAALSDSHKDRQKSSNACLLLRELLQPTQS